jgi:hypothetical protein
MTIIAGFPTKGFVVLGADGEEGDLQEKASTKKIAHLSGDGCACLVGGAGGGDFIELAVQEFRQLLPELGPSPSIDRLRTTLEEIVTDIYAERIDTLPADQQEYSSFRLLCALWTASHPEPKLVMVGRMVSLYRDRPDVIGLGAYLARYLIATLPMDDEQMTARHWQRLCAYILQKAKVHVQGCGGLSQVMVLDSAGQVETLPQGLVEEDEHTTGLVMDKVRWLFNWSDPVGWKGNLANLEGVIDRVAEMMKADIREHIAELRRATRLGD